MYRLQPKPATASTECTINDKQTKENDDDCPASIRSPSCGCFHLEQKSGPGSSCLNPAGGPSWRTTSGAGVRTSRSEYGVPRCQGEDEQEV